MNPIPFIPETAPFSPSQRQWLNGYLAGVLSDARGAGGAAAATALATPKPRVLLMFGSQSGNAESLADSFSEKLTSLGFEAPVVNMEDHGEVDLTKEERLLVVSSTWGEGDPPDNAAGFWKTLSGEGQPRLENLGFAVCGLGDSNYLDFCGMGKKFDARLEELGAKRLVERIDCDVDFEGAAETWISGLKEKLDVKALAGGGGGGSPPLLADGVKYSKKNPFLAPLAENRQLNVEGSERDIRHFGFDLAGFGLDYEVGDVLGVLPQNCPTMVDDLIRVLGCDGEEAVPAPGGGETSFRVALLEHYNITQPNKKFLAGFAELAGDPDFDRLLEPGSEAQLSEYLWGREIVDLVARHPGCKLTPQDFVALLGKLSPRLYSIASSPKAHAGQVHLTVAAVRYHAHGKNRKGVCSTYLADRVVEGGEVPIFFQTAKHFKLPADGGTPIVMVGPGTGIAPFRAFLHERKETGAAGDNWLFFGNPYQKTDFLYKDELIPMVEGGHLTRLDTAWSRDQKEKIYVQQKMLEAGASLWKWLDEGGHFYVCGDAKRMAKDVDAALHRIVAEHGGKGEDGAAQYVEEMKKQKRYQRDVY